MTINTRINPTEACKRYGIVRSTLYLMSKRGDLPEPHRTTSKIIHWNRAELNLIFFGKPPTETGKLHTLNLTEKMELEE